MENTDFLVMIMNYHDCGTFSIVNFFLALMLIIKLQSMHMYRRCRTSVYKFCCVFFLFDRLIAHVLFVSVCWVLDVRQCMHLCECLRTPANRRRFRVINWPFPFEFVYIDPRTNDWPLIASPVPGLTILGAYLYFILSWGPRYMANRKPYKLENILIAYNLIQVIVSTYIFYEVSSFLVLSNREQRRKNCYINAIQRSRFVGFRFYLVGWWLVLFVCFFFTLRGPWLIKCIQCISYTQEKFQGQLVHSFCWFVHFSSLHGFQGAFHGWFAHYNWRCQPVNTSTGPDGMRVCVHCPFLLMCFLFSSCTLLERANFRKWIQQRQR